MPSPSIGDRFPDFQLGDFDSSRVRLASPLVVVVWRTGCPTCRLAIPFFDRLASAYPKATVVAVCQETEEETRAYVSGNGLTSTHLADADLTVTRSLGVDIVPAYWLVGQDGLVLERGVGWDRAHIESVGSRLAALTGIGVTPIVLDSDGVPAAKPG